MNPSQLITFPVRVAARGLGLVKGTASQSRRLVRAATPSSAWPAATDTPSAVPTDPEPAPVNLGTEPGPVNVHEELGLDPAPVEKPHTRRQPAVTAIDQQAEPDLVESTPADVAARLGPR